MSNMLVASHIAAASVSDTYQTLMPKPTGIMVNELLFLNDLNQAVLVDIEAANPVRIPALTSIPLADFVLNPHVQVKHAGTAPTTGAIQCLGIRRN